MEFPYRSEGRKAPDRAPRLIASVIEEAERYAADLGCAPAEIAFGGRSMGGRICSMAIAEGLPAAAVVLLSYPLHPPGKPDSLRVEHFPSIDVPCLFISGTRDPFGTSDEFARWTPTVGGPVEQVWVEGGRHDVRGADEFIADHVARFVGGLG